MQKRKIVKNIARNCFVLKFAEVFNFKKWASKANSFKLFFKWAISGLFFFISSFQ